MDIALPIKNYSTGRHRIFSCQYHVIFCPKYRRKVLTDGVDTRLKELVQSKESDFGYTVLAVEVMPDHVHMILDIDPITSPISVITKLKGFLAHQLRAEFPILRRRLPCLWSRSKFISTVGSVSLEVVKQYIENQKNV